MIGDPSPPPQSYGPSHRDNNLLCFAAIMFFVGYMVIQVPLALADLSPYFTIDPTGLAMAIAVGIIPVIIGVYLLWKWYNSGT